MNDKIIKLDSGFLLNLSAVAYISNAEMTAFFKQPVVKDQGSFTTENCFGVGVTSTDIDRIAKAFANDEEDKTDFNEKSIKKAKKAANKAKKALRKARSDRK